MWRSHDENGSLQMHMYSLGVMDLDLFISADVFGLRAFDPDKPISRMLPGSLPCELRLMLPDAKLGIDGFHDVIITCLLRRPGGRHTFRRRTFHHCTGVGRKLCSTPCAVGRRMWSASAATNRRERTRRFATVHRGFVVSVIPECTRLWTPT